RLFPTARSSAPSTRSVRRGAGLDQPTTHPPTAPVPQHGEGETAVLLGRQRGAVGTPERLGAPRGEGSLDPVGGRRGAGSASGRGDPTPSLPPDQASRAPEPRTHESGRSAGQRRLSKRGPGDLRHALSMATLVAVRFRPEWQARYQRLLARGRAKKEALTILSRKLLKVISHLLRTGASYDPAPISPSPPAGPGLQAAMH